MEKSAEQWIDRTSLRRKLSFWRVFAFAILALAIVVAIVFYAKGKGASKSSDHIAQIRIEGVITYDEKLLKNLKVLRESDAVKGVILTISSPGGTTVGGETIYDAVRELAKEKPVVAQVNTLAASAGYMVALASDHIIAHRSSIIGSIGVLVELPNFKGLLDKLGIEFQAVKSSPLKAEPSPFNETTPAEKEVWRKLIMDTYQWFVGLVVDRRPLDEAAVRLLADGSVFTGSQAVENKLIDAIGGKQNAIEWLEGKGVPKELEVIEWASKDDMPVFNLPFSALRTLAFYLGLSNNSHSSLDEKISQRLFLDGLLSLWQPVPGKS